MPESNTPWAAHLRGMTRLLVTEGHLTPVGERQLEKVITQHDRSRDEQLDLSNRIQHMRDQRGPQ